MSSTALTIAERNGTGAYANGISIANILQFVCIDKALEIETDLIFPQKILWEFIVHFHERKKF